MTDTAPPDTGTQVQSPPPPMPPEWVGALTFKRDELARQEDQLRAQLNATLGARQVLDEVLATASAVASPPVLTIAPTPSDQPSPETPPG